MDGDADSVWQGRDRDGIECHIAREQWEHHVAKRPEIRSALALTVRAMTAPDRTENDKHHLDEARRYFRLLTISAEEIRVGYDLKVSVKYVVQANGNWIKFYQSCWFERH